LAWRVDELLDEENRTNLGRALTGVVHAADERMLPGATPLDRVGVRTCRPELLELASRLHDLGAPVRPRGVLLVGLLLDDSSGPLYGRGDPVLLRRAINDARRGLDGD
jgi:hypothetical protein